MRASDACPGSGEWHYNGWPTCVKFGQATHLCNPLTHVCDGTVIGSANHQIDAVIEALKNGGLHPKCPLPRVSRTVVRNAGNSGPATVEYHVPPTHREVRAFRFVALAPAPSADVFELDFEESYSAEHTALRVCFVSSAAVGTLQGRRRDEWEVWRGYAESLVGPGHQVTMLFTDTASFKDTAAVEWLQTEVASIGATLELLEERFVVTQHRRQSNYGSAVVVVQRSYE